MKLAEIIRDYQLKKTFDDLVLQTKKGLMTQAPLI